MTSQYLAIHEKKILATGSLQDIVTTVKGINNDIEPIVLQQENLKRIDFSWRGDTDSILATISADKAPVKKRGRPKLGVTSKEVTLLPRHWEWLSAQRGGASVTLRRLIDDARNNASAEEITLLEQQRLDGFMRLILGDEAGYEEASRALFRNSKASFEEAIREWPAELVTLIMEKFNGIAVLHNG